MPMTSAITQERKRSCVLLSTGTPNAECIYAPKHAQLDPVKLQGMFQAICFICYRTEKREKNVLNMEFLLCLPDQRVLYGHIFLNIQNPYLDCRYKLIALKYLIKVTYVLD